MVLTFNSIPKPQTPQNVEYPKSISPKSWFTLFYYISSCSKTMNRINFRKAKLLRCAAILAGKKNHSFNPTPKFHVKNLCVWKIKPKKSNSIYATSISKWSNFYIIISQLPPTKNSIISFLFENFYPLLNPGFHPIQIQPKLHPFFAFQNGSDDGRPGPSLASNAPELSVSKMRKSAWRSLRRASSLPRAENRDRISMTWLGFSWFFKGGKGEALDTPPEVGSLIAI